MLGFVLLIASPAVQYKPLWIGLLVIAAISWVLSSTLVHRALSAEEASQADALANRTAMRGLWVIALLVAFSNIDNKAGAVAVLILLVTQGLHLLSTLYVYVRKRNHPATP